MTARMYSVEGMHCAGCVARVKAALKAQPGVIEAQVGLDSPQAIVSLQDEVRDEQLEKAVREAGHYSLHPLADTPGAGAPAPSSSGGGLSKWLGFLKPKKDCCG